MVALLRALVLLFITQKLEMLARNDAFATPAFEQLKEPRVPRHLLAPPNCLQQMKLPDSKPTNLPFA